MKRLTLALAGIAAALAATPASAADYRLHVPEQRLETADAALHWEHAYLALSAVDLAETIYALRSGKADEANPLMGKHPSTAKLIAVKAALSGLQFTLFEAVRRRDPHTALRVAQISAAMQAGVVGLNARIIF